MAQLVRLVRLFTPGLRTRFQQCLDLRPLLRRQDLAHAIEHDRPGNRELGAKVLDLRDLLCEGRDIGLALFRHIRQVVFQALELAPF